MVWFGLNFLFAWVAACVAFCLQLRVLVWMLVDVDLFVGWYMAGGCCWLLDLRFEFGVWFQYFFCCMLSLALQLMYALWRCGCWFDVAVMCFVDLI